MAAGLGFKTFTTGEVLTAADTNGYLMQGVLVFADAAARDAAITAPAEGQFAYTKDVNGLWYYDGAAWVASGATGDIEGVTAGTGISGGGTSGTVTITNSMATAIDAKGDLIGGTGADAFDRLAVGADGTQLVADSAEATGLKWATPSAGGKVLQVVNAVTSTSTNIATTSMTDTTLTATITPTLATSKILVLVCQQILLVRGNYEQGVGMILYRGATGIYDINNSGYGTFSYYLPGVTTSEMQTVINLSYYDSPATTSATTYKTTARALVTSNSGSITLQNGSLPSSITLLEIGA